jgi:hypothetical protein
MTFKSLDELTAAMKQPKNKELLISVTKDSQPLATDAKSPGAFFDPKAREWKYNDAQGKTILRQGQPVTEDRIAALKAIRVKEITVYHPGYFDLVCEELCGQGHGKMQGQVIIVTPEEFAEQFETAADSADAGRAEERTAVSRK